MQADRLKDSCDSRRSVEDIQVRLIFLLHIYLIVFSFLGLHILYGSSLYLGDKNCMTSHLHLHTAEIFISSVPQYICSIPSINVAADLVGAKNWILCAQL